MRAHVLGNRLETVFTVRLKHEVPTQRAPYEATELAERAAKDLLPTLRTNAVPRTRPQFCQVLEDNYSARSDKPGLEWHEAVVEFRWRS
jgi:hypothetical protein